MTLPQPAPPPPRPPMQSPPPPPPPFLLPPPLRPRPQLLTLISSHLSPPTASSISRLSPPLTTPNSSPRLSLVWDSGDDGGRATVLMVERPVLDDLNYAA
ncbi:hypothetical protein PIB30_004772 [Stylosanthes scabra]|uniref:Uncharacterized protein n=1 Tax=Stylosanthes scabra TaxID=79078 RepID=A0ABU6T5N7_9FABA|nr:hypothetical protein [Stylosanthes scabra]